MLRLLTRSLAPNEAVRTFQPEFRGQSAAAQSAKTSKPPTGDPRVNRPVWRTTLGCAFLLVLMIRDPAQVQAQPEPMRVTAADAQGASHQITAPTAVKGARRVVILTPRATELTELLRLLWAELQALGFVPSLVTSGTSPDGSLEVARVAREAQAVAVLRIVPPQQLEVWVMSRATGGLSLRDVIHPPGTEPLAARSTALGAVEVLRWSLDGSLPTRQFPAAVPAPAPPLESPVRERVMILGAAAYGQHIPGGASPGGGVSVTAGARLGAWGGHLVFAQPLVPSRLSSDSGRVDVRLAWLGLEATWDALPSHATLQPTLGLGVRLVSTQLSGVVEEPLVGTRSRDFSLSPALRPACAFSVTDHLQWFAEASLALSPRRTQLTLAGQSVGRLERWVGTFGLGARLALGE